MPNIFAFEFKAKLEVGFRLDNWLRMDFRKKRYGFSENPHILFFYKIIPFNNCLSYI